MQLVVRDVAENADTCTVLVTVVDNIPPTLACLNPTLDLDANGQLVVLPQMVANAQDNCSTAAVNLSQNTFDCSDIGQHTITVTATFPNVAPMTCTATVTVRDATPPLLNCQNLSINLNANGQANITVAQVDNAISDICGLQNTSLSKTNFNCSNLGANTVTLTADDVNGNSATCSATVTVLDNTAPTAV